MKSLNRLNILLGLFFITLVLTLLGLSPSASASGPVDGGVLRVPLANGSVNYSILGASIVIEKDQLILEAYMATTDEARYFSVKLNYLRKVGIDSAALTSLLLNRSLRTSLTCTSPSYLKNDNDTVSECTEVAITSFIGK